MPFVHLKHCLKFNHLFYSNTNVVGRTFIINRFNSTAHDSLWHKTKLEETHSLKHDDLKETRTLSYSSKNYIPTLRGRSGSLVTDDDVYNRLRLIQQRRSLQVLGQLNKPAEGNKVQSNPGLSSTTSSSQGGSQDSKKPPSKELLVGGFVAFVATGMLIKFFMDKGEEDKEGNAPPKHSKPLRFPPSSSDIPDEVPYLLIGGGTASFSAFRAIKTNDPTAKILVISQEPFYPYMRPPLSKEMFYNEDRTHIKNLKFKQWNGTVRSIFYEPDEFYIPCENLLENENGGIAVAQGWSVKALDPTRKIAYLNDGKQIKYKKCLLATGSKPKVEKPFDNINDKLKSKFNFYRGIKDFEKLEEAIANGASSIVIIGNGFLGSELACALGRRGKKKLTVTQVFKENQVMSKILPSYLCEWTSDKVLKEGVTIKPNSEVIAVGEKGNKVELRLNDGSSLLADQVIVSTGAEPVIDLAELAGLEIDSNLGGFLVNAELSARTDLYAAGDCACFYDIDLGRRRVEHHDHAVISGRLAGENMAGAHKPYLHQPMFWSDLGTDVGFEAIGIIDSALPTVGVFAQKDQLNSVEENTTHPSHPKPTEDYNKGVIFYLKNEIVVGIILWNLFNKMDVARLILREKKKFSDLNEVAKLFNIHSIKQSETTTEAAA